MPGAILLEQRKHDNTNNEQNRKKITVGSCRQVGDSQAEDPKHPEEPDPYGTKVRFIVTE